MKHLLIVEDNDLIVSAMKVVFEGEGFRVSTASDVQSGLKIASSDQPDVMLLDLSLPDGSGLEDARFDVNTFIVTRTSGFGRP